MTITIYKPKNVQINSFHTHAGDSFREIIDLWQTHGLVDVKESPDAYIWFGNVGDVLLYDRPTLQWLNPSLEYRVGLFGNPVANEVSLNSYRNVPWTFWGRRPTLLEQYHKSHGHKKGYDERTIESVFIGKIENNVQDKYRKTHDWSKCIKLFEMPYGKPGEYKYTQEEYLELLSKSRFGLSVRGFGPKCHREVELMGMGVVPLVTDDVDIVSYHDPPTEGTHFVRVSTPSDVERVIRDTTPEKWKGMSKACLEWYEKNVSVKGSFNTTCEIVASNQSFRKPSSVCTICTNTCMHDLRVFLKSFEIHEPHIPIVLLCDEHVASEVKSRYYKPNITIHQCLDKYSGMNRKQMESKGIWSDFMNVKSYAIDKALEMYKDTLMLDSDIVLMHNLPMIDTSKEIGLSPHFIVKTNVDKYGYYNGGYVYVNSKHFTNWWRNAIPDSKFYDQGCLEQAPDRFTHFEFDIQDNFGWWRLLECDNPNERARKFGTNKTCILYDSKPLRSIHTHLTNDNFPLTVKFNHFIKMCANKLPTMYPYLNTEEPVNDILTLLVQYYNDPNPERQAEIDYCFRYNLENPFIKRVVHFNEPKTTVPDWLSKHPKFVSVACKDRLTYKQAFEYASKKLKDNSFVAVMNADIFLTKESPWNEMCAHMKTEQNVVYALSRHDFDGTRLYKDPALQRLAYANAQDAWFFMTPMKFPVADCAFRIGTMGCDNAIAERFKRSGYLPINSPNKFKIGHYDICRGKNGSNYMQDKYKKMNKDIVSPEKDGQYLLPDIDAVQSVDSLLSSLNASQEYKYSLICDIMSKFIKINNK